MALHHHERLDGTGYPLGLPGASLSLEDRILIVCNTAEAMGSFRPYRRAASLEQVVSRVQTGKGTSYDPEVADCVVDVLLSGEFVLGI